MRIGLDLDQGVKRFAYLNILNISYVDFYMYREEPAVLAAGHIFTSGGMGT